MNEKFNLLANSAKVDIEKIEDLAAFNDIKAMYLGKKSVLNSLMGEIKTMTNEEKREFGQSLNELKDEIFLLLERKKAALEKAIITHKLENEVIDITLPSVNYTKGAMHLFHRMVDEINEIFLSLGFEIAEGPEVELDHYNFELLNIPKDHPSREMQDSFFIDEQTLLRSHTSSIQAHILENSKGQGTIKVVCPGKVYRRDEDATHSHQFGQIEGLVVDTDVNLATLLKTLEIVLKKLFGENRKVRFRPSYFPFTEPSVEVDVSCFKCGGKGCPLCKNSGWIEVLGAGMVHPNVLKNCGYDENVYQGFAFGMGLERLAMLKYDVDDIRKLFTNDVEFLHQFNKESL